MFVPTLSSSDLEGFSCDFLGIGKTFFEVFVASLKFFELSLNISLLLSLSFRLLLTLETYWDAYICLCIFSSSWRFIRTTYFRVDKEPLRLIPTYTVATFLISSLLFCRVPSFSDFFNIFSKTFPSKSNHLYMIYKKKKRILVIWKVATDSKIDNSPSPLPLLHVSLRTQSSCYSIPGATQNVLVI